jgi:hypothetical protein
MSQYPLMRRILLSDPTIRTRFDHLLSEYAFDRRDTYSIHGKGNVDRFRDALFELCQLVLEYRPELPTRSTAKDGTWEVCQTCHGDGNFVELDENCVSQTIQGREIL